MTPALNIKNLWFFNLGRLFGHPPTLPRKRTKSARKAHEITRPPQGV